MAMTINGLVSLITREIPYRKSVSLNFPCVDTNRSHRWTLSASVTHGEGSYGVFGITRNPNKPLGGSSIFE